MHFWSCQQVSHNFRKHFPILLTSKWKFSCSRNFQGIFRALLWEKEAVTCRHVSKTIGVQVATAAFPTQTQPQQQRQSNFPFFPLFPPIPIEEGGKGETFLLLFLLFATHSTFPQKAFFFFLLLLLPHPEKQSGWRRGWHARKKKREGRKKLRLGKKGGGSIANGGINSNWVAGG